jgi:hypothetical protein
MYIVQQGKNHTMFYRHFGIEGYAQTAIVLS